MVVAPPLDLLFISIIQQSTHLTQRKLLVNINHATNLFSHVGFNEGFITKIFDMRNGKVDFFSF